MCVGSELLSAWYESVTWGRTVCVAVRWGCMIARGGGGALFYTGPSRWMIPAGRQPWGGNFARVGFVCAWTKNLACVRNAKNCKCYVPPDMALAAAVARLGGRHSYTAARRWHVVVDRHRTKHFLLKQNHPSRLVARQAPVSPRTMTLHKSVRRPSDDAYKSMRCAHSQARMRAAAS